MKLNIKISELKRLNNNGKIKISQIEWWLLKYSDLFKKTYDFVYSQHLFTDDDGTVIRLPPFGKPTDHEIFLDLYEALDKISDFHRYEKYFEQELIEYEKIKNSPPNLKNWLANNEYLGADKHVCFIYNYLDYDENDQEVHLKVYIPSLEELEIYIDRKDFKNTIDFLEKFNELFWTNSLL
ncbi:hypothetical protein [Tamlana flava]|uniref:hypothetical protein n=1 Tax=Tamlana flava TaxID=3158572 RepID=UPI00351B4A44